MGAFCVDCGERLEADFTYCPSCGAPLRSESLKSRPVPSPPKVGSLRSWIFGLVGVSVLAALIIGGLVFQPDPEVKTCEDWYSHPTSVSHYYFPDTAEADIEFLEQLATDSSGTPIGRVMGDYASSYATHYGYALIAVESGWTDFLTTQWEFSGEQAKELRVDLVNRCDAVLNGQ